MVVLRVAAGLLIDAGRVLAARRGPGGEAAFRWEFPGGKLEAGELPPQALARELAEELNVQVAVGPLVHTVCQRTAHRELWLYCHLARILSGEIRLTEHLEYRWLRPDDLEALDWAVADRPLVPVLQGVLTRVKPQAAG